LRLMKYAPSRNLMTRPLVNRSDSGGTAVPAVALWNHQPVAAVVIVSHVNLLWLSCLIDFAREIPDLLS
jgi:hypothetical protein